MKIVHELILASFKTSYLSNIIANFVAKNSYNKLK